MLVGKEATTSADAVVSLDVTGLQVKLGENVQLRDAANLGFGFEKRDGAFGDRSGFGVTALLGEAAAEPNDPTKLTTG